MAKVRILIPKYVKEFTCIGTDCEDNCCKTWGINIDKATYQKYKKLNKSQFNPLKDKAIVLNKENRNSTDYARIRFREDGYCPFLTEDRLCGIYQKLSYSYMADICKSYPRGINRVDGELEMSLSLSCPEAGRKALLSKDIMEFEYVEFEYEEYMKSCMQNIYTQNPHQDFLEQQYFWDIRMAGIDILQNRRFSIVERLMLLGMLYKKIDVCIEEKKYNDIPEQIYNFSKLVDSVNPEDIFADMQKNREIQIYALNFLMYNNPIFNSEHSEKTLNLINAAKEVLATTSVDDYVDDISFVNYSNYVDRAINPFIKENSHIIEHYLVNLYFYNCMPFVKKLTGIWDSLVYLCMQYAVLKIFMIGHRYLENRLNEDDAVKIIYLIGRDFEHKMYQKNVMVAFGEKLELNTLGGLYILIHD